MTTAIQKMLDWPLFSRHEETNSVLAIIKWWELRRIAFNIAVGICGVITLAMLVIEEIIASSKFDDLHVLPDPPMIALFAVIAYGIGANICYTSGWIIELLVKKIWGEKSGAFWQITFFLGMIFSIILTLAPCFFSTFLLIIQSIQQ